MKLKTIDNIEVKGKVVLLRCDLNVPISEDGEISDFSRIERLLPTVSQLSSKGAKIALLSHFGRPNGKYDEKYSLGNIADGIAEILNAEEITVLQDCVGSIIKKALKDLPEGGIALLENVRFYAGEEKNDNKFSQSLAKIADIYINDAFSVAHRKHSSVEGITKFLPSYAGRSFQFEIDILEKVLGNSLPPVMAIIGGSKVSSKLKLLENLVKKTTSIAIGGGMANTFLVAQNIDVGVSFYEKGMVKDAKNILKKAEDTNCKILLPTDAVVANSLDVNATNEIMDIEKIKKNKMILDIGPKTIDFFSNEIINCKTLLWNGPLGVFEVSPYDKGTSDCALTVAMLSRSGAITSIAGGGDTIAALNNADAAGGFTYVSVAGGAFLEWIEGKVLPGVKVLMDK